MHKFDCIVKEDAALFGRYMDDYLRNIKSCGVDEKLQELNNLHPSLKFTIERGQLTTIFRHADLT